MELSWRNALTSRLRINLLKLNVLDLLGLVSEQTKVGSSDLTSVCKLAFTDGSWKIRNAIISSTTLFRKEILQVSVGPVL